MGPAYSFRTLVHASRLGAQKQADRHASAAVTEISHRTHSFQAERLGLLRKLQRPPPPVTHLQPNHTHFDRTKPPSLSQPVFLAGEQAFKHTSYGSHSHSKHQKQQQQTLSLFNLLSCEHRGESKYPGWALTS